MNRTALSAVAALAAVAVLTTACTSAPSTTGGAGLIPTGVVEPSTSVPPSTPPPPTAAPTTAPAATSASAVPGAPVHVSLLEGDGGVYGIGMPIIAYFDRAPTDASGFTRAVTVTVNGAPAAGAWYWQRSGHEGAALEAHYRLRNYWPAHAKIFVDLPVKGLSAGRGLSYDNDLTLSIRTGAANITTVDGTSERMTVTSDGKTVFTFPVSLGAADTPTYGGVKIVMEKDRVQRMTNNPGQQAYDLKVPWSVRLTNSGEFVHSASWNGGNIGVRSTSHGCTNLNVADAKRYFDFANVGDVFTYVNTGGPKMPSWDGYGDWNVPWPAWQAGGLLT